MSRSGVASQHTGTRARELENCQAIESNLPNLINSFVSTRPGRGSVRFSGRIGMPIEKVGVAGCGLMGSGIAQVCAQAGCQVVVREVSTDLVGKGLKSIEKNLQRLVEKGIIPEPARGQIRG